MKKAMLAALCAVLLMTVAATAFAWGDPYITNGEYEAYIGENNHLFLLDPAGGVKVLRASITGLVGMTDTELYCTTAENRVYGIRLDGSSTRIVANDNSEASVVPLIAEKPWEIMWSKLTFKAADGTVKQVAELVVSNGSDNGLDLYFIRGREDERRLCRVTLSDPMLTVKEICGIEGVPEKLTASLDAVTVLMEDRSVIIVNLQDYSRTYMPAVSTETNVAVTVGGQLLRYIDDRREYTFENAAAIAQDMVLQAGLVSVTPTPTPTPRPTPTATPKPTKKPTATPTPDDGSIHFGDRGSDVKKMQKRLNALGYPTGNADGVFGKNTLLALNLFQGAVKYRERDYATESLLNRLYRKDAPAYDQTAPLMKGDKGMAVELMQQALQDQGYSPEKVDGIYGKDTQASVRAFQLDKGLPATGEADRFTLAVLYKLPGAEDVVPDGVSTYTDMIVQTR